MKSSRRQTVGVLTCLPSLATRSSGATASATEQTTRGEFTVPHITGDFKCANGQISSLDWLGKEGFGNPAVP